MPDPVVAALLFTAGLVAGLLNAVAGGGSFVTFPALLSMGLPPLVANGTNAVAVWPGHALAVYTNRHELQDCSRGISGSIVTALSGGAAGAFLLGYVGNERFHTLIPYLILFATALFAFGPKINQKLASRPRGIEHARSTFVVRSGEFALALYGGFFGAGLGILLMAGLQMLGDEDIQTCNSLKNLLATVIGTVSVAVLFMSGWVSLSHAVWPFTGAVMGGVLGAKVARRLSAPWLRRVVVVVGLALFVYYFQQA